MHEPRQTSLQARTRIAFAAGLVALLAVMLGALSGGRASAASTAAPSFVLIQTDDQTLEGLYAAAKAYPNAPETRAMPATLDLIAKKGITFNRYYVSYPLCCPSRVSLLTGRYAHNHNVRGNVSPNGGYVGFSFRGAYSHNLATWLSADGYKTIHIGKFLNGYGEEPWDNGTTVPPGWSSWYTILDADRTHYYYGYKMDINGQVVGPFGDPGSWETREYGVRDDPGCPVAPANGQPCYYVTDTLTNIATSEIRATPSTQPFYLQLDYTAPHGDFRRPAGPEPSPRHYDWFRGAALPHDREEGFDEGNVSDKPRFIREAEPLSPSDRHTYLVYWQKQLEALRDVDDGVRQIVDTLGQMGRLKNTYIIFTSDNGFFFGEHRLLGGKFLAYEPATHLPLLIRGPGVKPNTSTGELAANIDIAPTVLELAGAKADKSIDGHSLVPYMQNPELRDRIPILFESFVETNDVEAQGALSIPGDQSGASQTKANATPDLKQRNTASASLLAPPKDYSGIRLGPYKYIAWPDGEKELYDLNRDPYELNSIVNVPNFFPIRNFLHREMLRLTECSGRSCSEPSGPFPLTRKEAQRLQAQKRREVRERERQREREKRERERGHGHPHHK
jgi:arylsulfatase A-like enzyme